MGNIQVFNKHTNDGTLKVSIPVGNITTDGKVEFLLFKIDLNKFRKKASWAAISLFLTFGIMIFFLSYLYGSTIKRSEEYEQAFNQVDLVMYKSFVPYCRLDARDQIKDANPAFCDTLEYDPLSEDDLKLLHRRKFSTLCADEDSLKIYKEIEEKRRLNEEVVPYKMRFRCKSGNTKELLVVSGQFPFSLKGKLPETFGILLDPNNKEQNKYFEEYKNYLFPQSSR
jgi:PAS domain-containing protein